MEGEACGNLLGPEASGVFFLVEQLDFTHPHPGVIKIELLGVIDGVAQFDFLADVGRGHFVERALEADGGIVVDAALMPDEEDLIELAFGQPPQLDSGNRGIVALDGFSVDAGMQLVVVVLLEPDPEELIEFLKAHPPAGARRGSAPARCGRIVRLCRARGCHRVWSG